MPNNHMNARLYAQHEVELMVPIIVISSFIMLIQCISCLVISSPHHKQQQLPGKNKQQQQLVIDEEENRGWLDFSISLLIAAYICLTNRPSKPAMWPTRLAGPTCQRDTVQQGITLH
ncbi:hypothetical protein DAI22_11g242200 [Oryza sativa Japonica Group]|nr:hypothetical protein DAI22_11g242200 [Oryza sativa Japonica Group]KAF2912259.1 hypothetical protein DAI22_11g242200 [Oryza sativa Japonica Group]